MLIETNQTSCRIGTASVGTQVAYVFRMFELYHKSPVAWMGLAVDAEASHRVCDELRAVLPEGARVVHVTDKHDYRETIKSLLRGGETGVVGHADPSRKGDLMILMAPLKQFASIRHVFAIGEPPSVEAGSIAMRAGVTWLDLDRTRELVSRLSSGGSQQPDSDLAPVCLRID